MGLYASISDLGSLLMMQLILVPKACPSFEKDNKD
jgi:hypothetical protein